LSATHSLRKLIAAPVVRLRAWTALVWGKLWNAGGEEEKLRTVLIIRPPQPACRQFYASWRSMVAALPSSVRVPGHRPQCCFGRSEPLVGAGSRFGRSCGQFPMPA
jgi:hypothetical protein